MSLLEQMRISTRLIIAGLAVLLGLMVISGYTLMQIKTEAFDAHKSRIKDQIEVSKGIIGNYQKLEADRKLSREEAQLQAREALRSLRFGNGDYYFLYDFEARTLVTADPKAEGTVMLGKTDAKGFKLWDAFVEIGKGLGSGYVEYWFPRAGETEPKPKLAYVLAIPEWNWIVGTGVYVDDVDATINRAALRYSILSFVVLAVVMALGLLVSRSVVTQLGGEPQEVTENMRRIASGELGIEIILKKDDTSSLMFSLTQMQTKLINITSAIKDNASSLTGQVQDFDGVAKSYAETKSDTDLFNLNRVVKKLGKTADILGKSIARFRL